MTNAEGQRRPQHYSFILYASFIEGLKMETCPKRQKI